MPGYVAGKLNFDPSIEWDGLGGYDFVDAARFGHDKAA